MPQRRLAVCTLVLASAGSLTAHHSLANHDTATPVRVKGTVVQFQRITAELLVMPDGREQSWGDYGFHRCFAPGYKDQHAH